MRARLRALVWAPEFWLIAAALVLATPIAGWVRSGASALRMPLTPMDNVNLRYSELWLLARDSAAIIPPGRSYTAIARDPDSETLLFAMSLGLLPAREPIAKSYWGLFANRPEAESAEFVISDACIEPSGPHRLRRRLPTGCVFERGRRAP